MLNPWMLSYRSDPSVLPLADRHYSRQHVGSNNFVPPGRCMVLKIPNYPEALAVWATHWPFAEYVRHAWKDAWICSIFRNESEYLSSELIIAAVATTRWYYRALELPSLGMITFVDASKVKHKRDPGRCFIKAGFNKIGETGRGLVVLQLPLHKMPEQITPYGYAKQLTLWEELDNP